MKNKRTRKLIIAAILSLLCVVMTASVFSAASLPSLKKKYDMFRSDFGMSSSAGFTFPKGTKFSKLKSSNTNVITLKKGTTNSYGVSLDMYFKKAGTSTISFTAKYKGKTKKYSIRIRSYKYVNPLASLTFGGKQYKADFDTYGSCVIAKKSVNKKLKIRVKAAAGWKLKKMYLWKNNRSYVKKNGSSFKITDETILEIQMKNTATGAVSSIYVFPFME